MRRDHIRHNDAKGRYELWCSRCEQWVDLHTANPGVALRTLLSHYSYHDPPSEPASEPRESPETASAGAEGEMHP